MTGDWGRWVALAVLGTALLAADTVRAESPAEGRPRICLVLSGGGARGAAHVGVIRTLEELRIPVDCITGTSMGAVVGSIYASGVSPEEVEAEVGEIDWAGIFDDRPPRETWPFQRKLDEDLLQASLQLDVRKGKISLPGGLLGGRKLTFELRKLLMRSAAIEDFSQLPIPYRAVAADITTGEEVTLTHGDLPLAVRASMAIPAVFDPVVIDGRQLVDGGIRANLPVRQALEMGADVIIAVDISSPLKSPEDDVSLFASVDQLTGILTTDTTRRGVELLRPQDILIVPRLEEISAASFSKVNEAIEIGAGAAEAARERLAALSVSEEEFAAWKTRTRRAPIDPFIDRIEVEENTRLSPDVLLDQMDTRAGTALDLDLLADDLTRLAATDYFDLIDFRLIPIEGDRYALLIRALDRRIGAGRIEAGLELYSDLKDVGDYRFAAGYRHLLINRLGGQWKVDFDIGSGRNLLAEVFQPLGTRGVLFVAPSALYSLEKIPLAFEGQQFALYRSESLKGQLDLGVQFRQYAQLRVGAYTGKIDFTPLVAIPGFPRGEARTGGVRVALAYDQLDALNFPTRGIQAGAVYDHALESFGADEKSQYVNAQFGGALSFGERDTLFAYLLYSSTLEDNPPPRGFSLGGPFRLSALPVNELLGEHRAFASLRYYHRLAPLPSLVGRGLYAGATIEAGQVSFGDGFSLSDLDEFVCGSLYVAADTLLGPIVFGYSRGEEDRSAFFFTLGLPLERSVLEPF